MKFSSGEVLGRQTMGVKVCSCPRRDMEKEQQMLRRALHRKIKEDTQFVYQLEVRRSQRGSRRQLGVIFFFKIVFISAPDNNIIHGNE